jgi:drug/metabolite transporter (DMT)-like permease
VAVLLGLSSAVIYGTADFIGGLVTRRNPATRVVLLAKSAGLLLYLAAVPLLIGEEVTGATWGWGLGAGVAGAVGISFLYRGLARGRISVVAPTSAVVAAILPLLFGLAIGERPTPLQMVGVAVAILAVALVSAVPEPGPRTSLRERLSRSGLPAALISGLGLGGFLILLTRAGDDSGAWPLVAAHVGQIALMGLLVAATRTSARPDPGTGKGIATAGVLDAAANLLYLLGTRLGLISVVAVLTSLYPAATVLLARVFLRDRLSRIQMIGLVLALAGVLMLTAGGLSA